MIGLFVLTWMIGTVFGVVPFREYQPLLLKPVSMKGYLPDFEYGPPTIGQYVERYPQMYQGTRIFGAFKIKDRLTSQIISGKYVTIPPGFVLDPDLSMDDLRDKIKTDGATIKSIDKVIYSSNQMHLAYCVLLSGEQDKRVEIYDANSGNLLMEYGNTQATRETYDAINGASTSSSILVLSDGNTSLTTTDSCAIKTHSNAKITLDYYRQRFNRNSFDNNGSVVKSYIHWRTGYANAQADPSCNCLYFGDGFELPCSGGVLDIYAHEFTHLVDFNEASLYGGVAESLSDILGAGAEQYHTNETVTDPLDNVWMIGEELYKDHYNYPRILSPLELSQIVGDGFIRSWVQSSPGIDMDSVDINASVALSLTADGRSFGCTRIVNNMVGKICYVLRGDCVFSTKVTNCKNAGAVAVIIQNNVDIVTTPSISPVNIPVGIINASFGNITLDFLKNGSNVVVQMGKRATVPVERKKALRSMCDPSIFDGVDYYIDYVTVITSEVHDQAGIMNLVFCLLSLGGYHPQNKSSIYVPPIGMENSLNVFYHTITHYLLEGSDFSDMRRYIVRSAIEMGLPYDQVESVRKAWSAVGVFDNFDQFLLVHSSFTDGLEFSDPDQSNGYKIDNVAYLHVCLDHCNGDSFCQAVKYDLVTMTCYIIFDPSKITVIQNAKSDTLSYYIPGYIWFSPEKNYITNGNFGSITCKSGVNCRYIEEQPYDIPGWYGSVYISNEYSGFSLYLDVNETITQPLPWSDFGHYTFVLSTSVNSLCAVNDISLTVDCGYKFSEVLDSNKIIYGPCTSFGLSNSNLSITLNGQIDCFAQLNYVFVAKSNEDIRCVLYSCSQSCDSESCTCYPGYSITNDGVTCVDVDECGNNNGNCSHQCVNYVGTYACNCPPGFVLSDDERTCVEVTICNTSNPCVPGASCIANLSSAVCQCPNNTLGDGLVNGTGCVQCTSGPCCVNGRFASNTTLCRDRISTCDITEFCSGFSSECPSDHKKKFKDHCVTYTKEKGLCNRRNICRPLKKHNNDNDDRYDDDDD
eukprot:TRINITY_DN7181_c0_g1_i1.p1 TRINITY_DN7181_c0_g1~~TRINITY_DN7181_c0_g1_i1.p1  ORF type:complete len:1031 (+),score=148.75 TRINITY_DN7181_c0_g1_i1:353-3445(+)